MRRAMCAVSIPQDLTGYLPNGRGGRRTSASRADLGRDGGGGAPGRGALGGDGPTLGGSLRAGAQDPRRSPARQAGRWPAPPREGRRVAGGSDSRSRSPKKGPPPPRTGRGRVRGSATARKGGRGRSASCWSKTTQPSG